MRKRMDRMRIRRVEKERERRGGEGRGDVALDRKKRDKPHRSEVVGLADGQTVRDDRVETSLGEPVQRQEQECAGD